MATPPAPTARESVPWDGAVIRGLGVDAGDGGVKGRSVDQAGFVGAAEFV